MSAKIVVHGGAGFWYKNIRKGLHGVLAAASTGNDILKRGGMALDAVEEAVALMEDNPVFNAGKGSSLTAIETVEMDAAMMDGRDLSAGAVALVREVKNPIRLARLVMEKTNHVLLAGECAERLARIFSLPRSNPVTAERRRILRRYRERPPPIRVAWIRRNLRLVEEHPELIPHDTVGAVAVDHEGNFAAATSTGGVLMKLPGRIGDTPLVGAGLYADNLSGAATATGIGEVIVRLALSKDVCSMMGDGLPATKAAIGAIMTASKRLKGDAGVIAIDRRLRVAAVHNTPYMPWAFSSPKMRSAKGNPRGTIVAALR